LPTPAAVSAKAFSIKISPTFCGFSIPTSPARSISFKRSAVYKASKAFLDSFSFALRAELKERGVTVTCLMPGATETEFF
jgi:NAD(P)-dependent dehydrogenase (short-subunit alcohol dehydrogenase family)